MALPRQTPRCERRLVVRVAEDVGKLEPALADEALRVDGEPASLLEVEDVAVVQVAVQNHDVARLVQEFARHLGRVGQDTSMARGGGRQRLEPTP
jgi:hypothetical protein